MIRWQSCFEIWKRYGLAPSKKRANERFVSEKELRSAIKKRRKNYPDEIGIFSLERELFLSEKGDGVK